MRLLRYIRGSVWWYNRQSDEPAITKGDHPCVIISSDEWNSVSSSVVVIPCTSNSLRGTTKDIKLDLGKSEGYFFPTQITTVPKRNLSDYQGVMPEEDMIMLDTIVQCVLGQCNYKALGSYINMNGQFRNYPSTSEDDFNVETGGDIDDSDIDEDVQLSGYSLENSGLTETDESTDPISE